MTVDQARREEIAAKIHNGRPQAEIAAEYGVSVRTIGRISKQLRDTPPPPPEPTDPIEIQRKCLMTTALHSLSLANAALEAVDPTDLVAVRSVASFLSAAVRAAEAAIKLIPPDTGINIIVRIGDRPYVEGDGWKVVSDTPDYDPSTEDAPPDATLPAPE